ncbi:MAG: type II toxin-antitoxin system Phd/YefM family antitoxin [Egibacteraceae bacterium]
MTREEIAASEFKARCLRLLDQVSENGIEYIVTKHGKPVARVAPLAEPPSLEGSVRVLVESESAWFSTTDLVEELGDLDPET